MNVPTHNNMDESFKHNVEWKQLDLKYSVEFAFIQSSENRQNEVTLFRNAYLEL